MSADLLSVGCFFGVVFLLNPSRVTTGQIPDEVLFEKVEVN